MIPEVWELCLKKEEARIGKEAVDLWLRSLKIVRFSGEHLFLEATDPIQLQWIQEHFLPRVELFNQNGRKIKLHLDLHKKDLSSSSETFPGSFFDSDRVEKNSSFETLIQSEKNSPLFQILQRILTQEEIFNPTYLYGSEGSGKTHLLKAIKQFFDEKGKKALFVSADSFTQHMIAAIQSGRMNEFRAFYRAVDILLIDDIERLKGRFATQEEFFHTFNHLHTLEKLIFLASSQRQAFLKGIEERLISRFEWGITLELHPLVTPAELLLFAANKDREYNTHLSQEQLERLCKECPSVKRIERFFFSLLLNHRQPLSFESLLEKEKIPPLSEAQLLEIVARHFNFSTEELFKKSQAKSSVFPRQVSMYLLRKWFSLPYMKIAEQFDKDHSTVISSVRAIEKRIEKKDEEMSEILFSIEKNLKEKAPLTKRGNSPN